MASDLGELHITVATTGNEQASFDTELRMVKAAVLYADKVNLLTPTHTKVNFELKQIATSVLSNQIADLDDSPSWEDARGAYHLLNAGHRSENDLELLHQHRDSIEAMVALINDWIEAKWLEVGGEVLVKGAEAGVIELKSISASAATDHLLEQAAIEAIAELFESATSGADAPHPLLHWWDWMVVTSRGIDMPRPAPVTEVAIAEKLLGGLECFPDAPIDELLDLRSRLEAPLLRFRTAIAGFASEVDADRLGSEFERRLRDYYRLEVAPALLELDELMEDLGARKTLHRAGATAVKSLGIAFAELLVFAEIFASALTPVGSAAGAEIKHRLDVRAARRKNDFFFLWEVDRSLS